MRRALLLLALVLATPCAAAWPVTLTSAPAEVSLRESLLLAGALDVTAEDGAFGAPHARRLTFDTPVAFDYCPDRAGEPQQGETCADGERTTNARLYVLAGGFVAQAPGASMTLTAPATAAALGGPNVTLNTFALPPGVFAGGESVVVANATTLVLRPLGATTSLEVRGEEGFRVYNGSAYTLRVANLTRARLEATGAFVASPDAQVVVSRAPLATAEQELRVEELFTLLRAVQPAERADRRADVAEAFGPFQLVPALLNGAAAARTNLTLGGEARDDFTFLRVEDLRLGHDGTNWTGSGNATYMVDGGVVQPRPDAQTAFPVIVPVVFLAAAIAGRTLTERDPIPKRRRRAAGAVRLVGLVLLALLVAAALAPLLGFSPLLDAAELARRSRVQLALLVAGVVGAGYLAVGLPSESLAKSAFAWRDQHKAAVWPTVIGLMAAAAFVWLAAAILLSFVARFVRL